MENNLELWNKFKETDPNSTKDFKGSGGFRGTSINGTYVAKRLTQEFGPWGVGWGWEILNEEYIDGGPMLIEGSQVGIEKIHVIKICLWFVYTVSKGEGAKISERITCPPHFGQTTFVGKNKYGPFTDEEAPKKSITDAVTKSASMLGMAADIFSGRYDDNKYVEDLREKYKEENGNGSNGKPASKMEGLKEAANGDSGPPRIERDLSGDPKKVLDKCLESYAGSNPQKRKSKLMMWGKKAGFDPKVLNKITVLDDLTHEQAETVVAANRDALAIPF